MLEGHFLRCGSGAAPEMSCGRAVWILDEWMNKNITGLYGNMKRKEGKRKGGRKFSQKKQHKSIGVTKISQTRP
ncbi:hypothetical protein NPIL_25541 [Nephila pilipes]|uniref:Uncharacterized protein n=1 Tax=Nephila pilipes TaxID=299642 RepID=A0A8X6QXP3_NEPPI|nr:hypothetical protein NPIL_25541 [Nephila pilipes]